MKPETSKAGRRKTTFVAAMLIVGAVADAQPSPPTWQGQVVLTVGGIGEIGGYSFGSISGLAVDKHGQWYIADRLTQQITVLSPTGARVKVIGNQGGGPLEFRRLGAIAVTPASELRVRDEGGARIAVIDVTTERPALRRNIPLPQFNGGSAVPLFPLADDSFIDEGIVVDPERATLRPTKIHRAASGKIVRTDTLQIPDGADRGTFRVAIPAKDEKGVVVGMSERTVQQPYGPRWIRAYGPDGLRADAVSSRYEVSILDKFERTIRIIRRESRQIALSDTERAKAQLELSRLSTSLPFQVPRTKAPIVALVWSRDGHLWVERSVRQGAPREADIFRRDGTHVATAIWPSALDVLGGLPWIEGKTVYAVVRDQDDVEAVVRVDFRNE